MDLTGALLRFAGRVPHVLAVPIPGRSASRMDVERALARRGWLEATSPGDADVLLVAGSPGADVENVVGNVWRRIPAPRVRVDLSDEDTAADLDRLLDDVPGLLADPHRAREEASAAAASADADQETGSGAGEHGDHSGGHAADEGAHAGHGDHAGSGTSETHADHTHDSHAEEHGDDSDSAHGGGHGAHGGHDHHAMGMALPGNLAMADLAADRDGLTLDVLNLSLGPVLPDWPAGLVLDAALQGDVITSATARVLDSGRDRASTPPEESAVRDLDVVARILAVAGWSGPAARTRDLRDRLRDRTDTDTPAQARELAVLLRRVRRSKTLRLMLRRTGAGWGPDVADLLGWRLDRLEAYVAGRTPPPTQRVAIDELGDRLAGSEFAAARLLVAALDPDVDGEPVAAGGTEPGR